MITNNFFSVLRPSNKESNSVCGSLFILVQNVLSNSSNNTIASVSILSRKLEIPGIHLSTIITGIPISFALFDNTLANNDLPIPLSPLKITPRFLFVLANLSNTLLAFSS